MLVRKDGHIECATRLACRWLAQFFGLKRGANRLPREVRLWLHKPQGKRGQCRPFVAEASDAQLFVSFLHPEADNCIPLLLVQRPGGASSARLRHIGLTKRETEVLALIAAGKTNGEVAAQLGVSESTIKTHVEHTLDKLGVNNRTEAAWLFHYSQGT